MCVLEKKTSCAPRFSRLSIDLYVLLRSHGLFSVQFFMSIAVMLIEWVQFLMLLGDKNLIANFLILWFLASFCMEKQIKQDNMIFTLRRTLTSADGLAL